MHILVGLILLVLVIVFEIGLAASDTVINGRRVAVAAAGKQEDQEEYSSYVGVPHFFET